MKWPSRRRPKAIQRLLAGGRRRRLRSRDRDATLRLPASIPWPNWSGWQRVVATAIVDRLLHQPRLTITGESYRLAAYRVANTSPPRSTRRPSALATSWASRLDQCVGSGRPPDSTATGRSRHTHQRPQTLPATIRGLRTSWRSEPPTAALWTPSVPSDVVDVEKPKVRRALCTKCRINCVAAVVN